MAEIRSILFPTDYSEHSSQAFPYAASLAEVYGARIIMLHVAELEESDPANPEHSFPALDAYTGEVERIVVRGHAPYKDILETARAKTCDLIVMATHGRSEMAQFFLGRSVAEDVSRHAEAPVFIVPVHDDHASRRPARPRSILLAGAGAARTYAEAFAQKFGAELQETASNDPDEIVRLAKELDVDLIVISGKGASGLRDEVVGTAADRVIQDAHCPVMTARG